MNTAIIGLGSNIEPQKNIKHARNFLAQEFKVLDESHFVTTKPIGTTTQPDFLNGAVLIETNLMQDIMRNRLKEIEKILGRTSSPDRYGPRVIDLDILVWNDEVINPDFYERDFVKDEVLELLPELKY